jgi:hypothetical protein
MSKRLPSFGVCKLCQQSKELQQSHIISKFLFREAGLLKQSFPVYCLSKPSKTERRQDGFKEYLLCRDCEQQLSLSERYARHQFYGIDSPFQSFKERGIIWRGLDYAKMKLFLISLLWRMSLSEHHFFGHVQLGDRHECIIRSMLLNSRPMEPWRYGCHLARLDYGAEPLGAIFSQPQRFKESGRTGYRFLLAGLLVIFDVCSHEPVGDNYVLQSDGSWPILRLQALSIPFVKEEIDRFRKFHRNTAALSHYC